MGRWADSASWGAEKGGERISEKVEDPPSSDEACFSISIADIPARLDQVRKRYYLRGPVALRLNDEVNELVKEVRRNRQAEPETPPLDMTLSASTFLKGTT